jgi:hypothetical protein
MGRSSIASAVFVQTDAVLAIPVLTPLKPCYLSVATAPQTYVTESAAVGGQGFDPGSTVDIRLDGETVATVTVDASGVLAPQAVAAPVVTAGQHPFSVTVADHGTGAAEGTLTSLVSALAVRARPRTARPDRRVRFSGRGFTATTPVYAHYLRKGVLRRTVRLAAPTGPCGTFSVRRRQFPFRPALGAWTVQFDQAPTVSADGPLVRLSIAVRRRAKA